MKNNFYFQHDYNARNDQKILQLRGKFGNEAYGIYWMVLECMAESGEGYLLHNSIPGIAMTFGVDKAQLMAQLDFSHQIAMFGKDEKGYFSPRMLRHLEFRNERSLSGKKGAKSRWENGSANGSAIAQPMQRKGKERKDNTYTSDFAKWLEAYNKEYSTKYKNKSLISNFTYWREQYSQEDLISIIPKLRNHTWLADKHKPDLVLRQRDQSGNPVDRIGELLSIKEGKAYL